MSNIVKIFFSLNAALVCILFFGVAGSFITRAKKINNYERVSLSLIKKNKELRKEISDYKFEIKKLSNANSVLALKLEDKILRRPASVDPVDPKNDLVELKTYRWGFNQLLASARDYFSKRDFVRSAQFYQTLLTAFPQHSGINDEVIYSAGIASFESRKYDSWAVDSFQKIVKEYPTSVHFRGAKLWIGLLDLRQGKKSKFFNVVEEFRKKYRNTEEWELISGHYYEIYKNFR